MLIWFSLAIFSPFHPFFFSLFFHFLKQKTSRGQLSTHDSALQKHARRL
ncbi:hypothetical protein HMPREF1991_03089 [Hoylesella loescheii DSM 19665 = JCM 12249 = ATCC 15930]|uniref:Uncharacterized protein n=1 Tax=Hoylesella loescheii DSM 19665 = JCM 12249 = ATCC 15930 TaxID=1122985 RepID=A0A069QD79_HOYLO|nr:hypothetical protein HMPREF1991_03089 [Hoylesella loescheii DSM 19665 = JCM 12249 = ATCC 15930]